MAPGRLWPITATSGPQLRVLPPRPAGPSNRRSRTGSPRNYFVFQMLSQGTSTGLEGGPWSGGDPGEREHRKVTGMEAHNDSPCNGAPVQQLTEVSRQQGGRDWLEAWFPVRLNKRTPSPWPTPRLCPSWNHLFPLVHYSSLCLYH